MKRTGIFLPILAAILVVGGCKKVTTSLNYHLTVSVQPANNALLTAIDSVVVHAFYGDTATWQIASYEDAERGVLTHRGGTGTLSPAYTREWKAEAEAEDPDALEHQENPTQGVATTLTMGPLQQSMAIVVACDIENKAYAWTQLEVPDNMDDLHVRICFRPWKTPPHYKEGLWFYFNPVVPAEEPSNP